MVAKWVERFRADGVDGLRDRSSMPLSLPSQTSPPRRALGTRAPIAVPKTSDDRRSLDFVSDQLACGRRSRILAIFDDCSREYLAAVADTSLSGGRVARELDRLIALRGKPKMIVSDNGTELTSNAILGWSDQTRVGWHYIVRPYVRLCR
jgi:putative transposase